MFVKALPYETANPDQNSTDNVTNHFDPVTSKQITHSRDDPDEFNGPTSVSRYGQVSAGGVDSRVPTLSLPLANGGTAHHTTTTEKDAFHNGPDLESGRP